MTVDGLFNADATAIEGTWFCRAILPRSVARPAVTMIPRSMPLLFWPPSATAWSR